ncbi:MAG: PAS domain S-box protein [Ilumatobacteraceae bacterium]
MKRVLRRPLAALRRNGEIESQEALLAAIVASSNDAILSYSLDQTIISWNPAAQRIFGYSADEMIGQPFSVLVPTERAGEAVDFQERLERGEMISNYETVRLRKDGSTVSISLTLSLIYDLTGAVIGGSSIYRDMTELKVLESQEALLAAIVTSSNDAIVSFDLDGVATSWNPGAERIFGYSADEIIGQPSLVFVHSEMANESADFLARIRKGQLIENFETVRLRKDGSAVPVSVTISPIYDLTGVVIGSSAIYRDITELKKSETQKALLAVIVESSNEAIWSYTLDGKVTVWNPAAERIFDYSADEMIGQIALDLYPSDKWDETVELIERIRRGQAIKNFETVRLKKDGSAVQVSLTVSPIYDLTGAVIGGSTICRDMTELKEFEMRNALLAAIVAASNDTILSFTLDGIITSWNPAAERTYGYSADEMISQPLAVLIPSEKLDDVAAILGKIRNGRSIVNYETVRQRKNGSTVPVMQTISPIYDLSGAVNGGSAICQDMTEFKRAEQKFYTIVESAPDAMVIVDKTGTITIVNSQTEVLFGYRRDEMLGQPVELIVPSRFQSVFSSYMDHFFVNPKVRQMGAESELFVRRKDGREVPVAINLSPIKTADGILGAATFRDVTDQKNMIRRLKEMNELRSEFVAVVAHDLRSPMTSISGYAQELINEWDATDDAKKIEYLQIIVRNTEHLAEFVEDVLQVARIEAGEYPYDIRAFNVRSLVQRALDETVGASHDRRFELIAPSDIPPVLGDEDRLKQVLVNLLSNAVKFSPTGQPIVVGLSCVDDSVQVAITDRGIGIATDDLPKLFTKFGRVSNLGVLKAPGNGLGLYICKTLVEAQSGRIWCESSPGRGSTFFFTIPVAR